MALVFLSLSLPALAEDIDPFQMDSGRWMSYGRYKDNVQRGLIPQQKTPLETPVNNADNPLILNATDATPSIAAPTRPLVLPVMPGMNKGFNVQIESTSDEKQTPAPKIVNMDSNPELHLQTQNWLNATEAARDAERIKAGKITEENHPPLNVRMSFLPDRKITPIPDAERKTTHGREPAETAAAPRAPSLKDLKALPADLAACVAAIDSYKKKQLDAIQSDRQTLAALQEAIAQLGLQKQLGFIADSKSSLNAQDAATKVDATATPRASFLP
jgi:hypothetical protein